ncbi:hypothetical protein [Brassicibacter mesophilus]|uniref:hypothetical protein n=1 Tax=Brassicibacter mesophilus TaxID=745119 RepID=UPI003D1DA77C
MKNIIRAFLFFAKIFLILFIIGILFPKLIDRILEIFILRDYNDTPMGNSTFVMSYNFFKEGFLYYFKRVLLYYFAL